jgi:hypothetical protein
VAEVWIIPKGATPPSVDPPRSEILALLKVLILPMRKLPVSIWRIQDGASTDTTLPPGIPSNAEILAVLRDVFRQAGIEPYLDGGSDTPVDIHYDIYGTPDGKLQQGYGGGLSVEEKKIYASQQFAGEKIRIFVVKDGNNPIEPAAYTNKPSRAAFVMARAFTLQGTEGQPRAMNQLPYTCAHELGHILQLSTRKGTRMIRGPGGTLIPDPVSFTHDFGPIPTWIRYGGPSGVDELGPVQTDGLMTPTGAAPSLRKWLRHEDWLKSNSAAREIIRSELK